MTQTTSRPTTEVSPLPTRALHASPGSATSGEVTIVEGPSVMMRKHPKQSLSQPTIPEEEGEEATNEAITSTVTSISSSLTSVLKPKPESRVVKNLAQELGAFSKDMASSLKKSSSFKEEKTSSTASVASASSLDSLNTEPAKSSPKLNRTESIGERTMQKISKVIRGSSRSESRSKKTRETSLSPTGTKDSKSKKDLSSKEKRDLFKSSGGQ